MSLVSVILAVYNCEQYIRESLDSLVYQSYDDLEILVCDDCSTDKTWDILRSYNDFRILLYRNETNKGVVITRNSLLSKAKGDYLVIQDADDWSEKNRIKLLVEEFNKDDNLDACGTACYRISNTGLISALSRPDSFYLEMDDCMNLPFMPATLMLRKSVYNQLGGYNDYFSGLYAEDLYWVMRMVEKHKVLYLNVPLYYYRFNSQSITNTVGRKDKLVVIDLIQQLIDQRKQLGTDWIEQNDRESIAKFVTDRFKDKVWLSEKYRIVAAVQRDGKKRRIALKMIVKAILYNPFSLQNYVTLRYVLS